MVGRELEVLVEGPSDESEYVMCSPVEPRAVKLSTFLKEL